MSPGELDTDGVASKAPRSECSPAWQRAVRSVVEAKRPKCPHCAQHMPEPGTEDRHEWAQKYGHFDREGRWCLSFTRRQIREWDGNDYTATDRHVVGLGGGADRAGDRDGDRVCAEDRP